MGPKVSALRVSGIQDLGFRALGFSLVFYGFRASKFEVDLKAKVLKPYR